MAPHQGSRALAKGLMQAGTQKSVGKLGEPELKMMVDFSFT